MSMGRSTSTLFTPQMTKLILLIDEEYLIPVLYAAKLWKETHYFTEKVTAALKNSSRQETRKNNAFTHEFPTFNFLKWRVTNTFGSFHTPFDRATSLNTIYWRNTLNVSNFCLDDTINSFGGTISCCQSSSWATNHNSLLVNLQMFS